MTRFLASTVKKCVWPIRSADEYLSFLKWRWRIMFFVAVLLSIAIGLLPACHPHWLWRELASAPWLGRWAACSGLCLIPATVLFSWYQGIYEWEKRIIKRDGIAKWFSELEFPEVLKCYDD